MKIAIFLESFQPEYWGGRETRWKNLIEFFSDSNELIIYGDFSRFSSDVAFPGVRAKFINIGPLPHMYNLKGNRSLKHAVLYTIKSYKILFCKSDILLTDQTPLISIPFLGCIPLFQELNFRLPGMKFGVRKLGLGIQDSWAFLES